MIAGLDCTDKEPPADSYTPITYAYDMLKGDEETYMIREYKRLQAKGEKVVVYYYDTRESGDELTVEVGEDVYSTRAGLFCEIWREKR